MGKWHINASFGTNWNGLGVYVGVRGGIRTHGPRIHTTSAFTAAIGVWRSWSGLSLHHKPHAVDRCCPSSLYTLPENRPWLGIGTAIARAFPEFEQIRHVVSRRDAQLQTRNPVLYPAELRGHTRFF